MEDFVPPYPEDWLQHRQALERIMPAAQSPMTTTLKKTRGNWWGGYSMALTNGVLVEHYPLALTVTSKYSMEQCFEREQDGAAMRE
jgi:hypothetical protein